MIDDVLSKEKLIQYGKEKERGKQKEERNKICGGKFDDVFLPLPKRICFLPLGFFLQLLNSDILQQQIMMKTMRHTLALAATLLTLLQRAESFSPSSRPLCLSATSATTSSSCLSALLSLELEKPLGIILEEVVEGGSEGVKVEELADSGSAYASSYRDDLVGLKVARVMDNDVTSKFVILVSFLFFILKSS